jgi:hypothetical protein
MSNIITEASIAIAEDGDVLITIPKPNGMNLHHEVLLHIKNNFLMLGQNKKCYAKIEILDIVFLEAIKAAPVINLAQCDDDGLDIFDNARILK